jgi:hypothetical protein
MLRGLRMIRNKILGPPDLVRAPSSGLQGIVGLDNLCDRVVQYFASVTIEDNGRPSGVRFTNKSLEPCLYAAAAKVLVFSLFGFDKNRVSSEIALIKRHQRSNGLFYDPVIDSALAWEEDWWGFRHLTMHCIMALAVFGEPCKYPLDNWEVLNSEHKWIHFIGGLNWGNRVSFTSNALQNYGVFLQYARDFQNSKKAGLLCDVLFEQLNDRINERTGLWGELDLEADTLRSEAIQAAYHFWLLYFYEDRKPSNIRKALPWLLKTQNPCGGYGVNWRSSCCECIDSIDPLARLLRFSGEYYDEVKGSLERGLANSMTAFNDDGGFTFRRGEAMAYGDSPATYQGYDESSTFFTWFRILSIALATQALAHGFIGEKPRWTWKQVPGLQFWPDEHIEY